jgi:DNA-damage-inducible protein J
MAKTAMIRARTEPGLKAQAENILNKLGMTSTEAINLFYKQIALRKGLPFDVKIPNKTTLKTMKDTDEGKNLTAYDSLDDFFKEMGV